LKDELQAQGIKCKQLHAQAFT